MPRNRHLAGIPPSYNIDTREEDTPESHPVRPTVKLFNETYYGRTYGYQRPSEAGSSAPDRVFVFVRSPEWNGLLETRALKKATSAYCKAILTPKGA